MTTTKKGTSRQIPSSPSAQGIRGRAGQISRRLGGSAQQIWLAGLGILGRAQSESSRVFDSLVKEGTEVQRNGRTRVEASAEAVKQSLGSRYAHARQKASGSWERLEKTVDTQVKNVLHGLHISDRDEVQALQAQIDALKVQVRANKRPARRRPASSPAATTQAQTPHPPAAGTEIVDATRL